MKDRLGKAVWWNRPLANKTQNAFVRAIRQPGSGLPDLLSDSKKSLFEMKDLALKTRMEEL